ncbi:MAG: hypothetical protein Q8Q31_00010 [Nanoarchaeota archaeon]|nr:hypothetical protein [Nanoarchaeota archaeon]
MSKNRTIFAIAFIFLIVYGLPGVLALGVTPGRTTLDFSPGLKKNVDVTVINSQKSNVDLGISVQGELSSSIKLKQNSLNMKSNEEEKKISFEINLPDQLEPGLHTAEIVIRQKSARTSSGQANINTELAVVTQVSVYVPYPGKYIDAQLSITGDEKRKKFVIPIVNRGKETIQKASAVISIYDSQGKFVRNIETNSISIDPSAKAEIAADWVVNVPQGRYNAKAVIDYDGQDYIVEKEFDVGEFVLDLMQVFVKDFRLGDIAKFNLVVRNKWNEPISRAYAEMRVFDEEFNEIADIKSATYDIPAGMKTEMVYYWDTKGVSAGLYNANIVLYYADKKTQQDLQLDVRGDRIEVIGLGRAITSDTGGNNKGLITILGVIIGFLIVLNLLWFFVLRKRKVKR